MTRRSVGAPRRSPACKECRGHPYTVGLLSRDGYCPLCAAVKLCEEQLGATVIAISRNTK